MLADYRRELANGKAGRVVEALLVQLVEIPVAAAKHPHEGLLSGAAQVQGISRWHAEPRDRRRRSGAGGMAARVGNICRLEVVV